VTDEPRGSITSCVELTLISSPVTRISLSTMFISTRCPDVTMARTVTTEKPVLAMVIMYSPTLTNRNSNAPSSPVVVSILRPSIVFVSTTIACETAAF